MAGRLSFSIAINLLTENFKRGTNQVKAAFRSMQMQILTFAAAVGAGGIGVTNLVPIHQCSERNKPCYHRIEECLRHDVPICG